MSALEDWLILKELFKYKKFIEKKDLEFHSKDYYNDLKSQYAISN